MAPVSEFWMDILKLLRKPQANWLKQHGDLLFHIIRSPEVGWSLECVASEPNNIISNPGSFHLHHQPAPGLTESSGWSKMTTAPPGVSHIHSGRCPWLRRLCFLGSYSRLSLHLIG